MDAPVPETSKDTESITLSRVTSTSSSSSFDGKKIMYVTPKRDFCIELCEIVSLRPMQETVEPASAELVILITPMRVSSAN